MRRRIVVLKNIKVGVPPVKIESMLKFNAANIKRLLKEARKLEENGVEILRMAVKEPQDLKALNKVKSAIQIPLIADIHFSYKLALKALEERVDCVRINPLNIYNKKEWREIAKEAKARKASIRIGVNSGGVRKKVRSKSRFLLKRLEEAVKFFENLGFFDIIISAKSSKVLETLNMNEVLYRKFKYPLHIGLTASGPGLRGVVKSCICVGYLLLKNIGDTVRISLTDTSLKEVLVTKLILQSLGLRKFFPELISCPTCGRTSSNLLNVVKKVDERLMDSKYDKKIKIAIMGCEVNGPGEARDADLGIAFSKKYFVYFEKGIIKERVEFEKLWKFLESKLDGFKRN